EGGRDTGADELLGRRLGRGSVDGGEERGTGLSECRRAGGEVRDRRRDVEGPCLVAEEPAGGPLRQDPRPEEHGDLCPRLDASVERLDLRPQAAQVEDLARNGEGAHDVRCRRTRLLAEAEYVGRSTSIDQTVRHLSGDDLALERVTRQ